MYRKENVKEVRSDERDGQVIGPVLPIHFLRTADLGSCPILLKQSDTKSFFLLSQQVQVNKRQ
jgi:hypothetical protein